jgi:hypothetical protein
MLLHTKSQLAIAIVAQDMHLALLGQDQRMRACALDVVDFEVIFHFSRDYNFIFRRNLKLAELVAVVEAPGVQIVLSVVREVGLDNPEDIDEAWRAVDHVMGR